MYVRTGLSYEMSKMNLISTYVIRFNIIWGSFRFITINRHAIGQAKRTL